MLPCSGEAVALDIAAITRQAVGEASETAASAAAKQAVSACNIKWEQAIERVVAETTTNIASVEDRLSKKIEDMEKRFVVVETKGPASSWNGPAASSGMAGFRRRRWEPSGQRPQQHGGFDDGHMHSSSG